MFHPSILFSVHIWSIPPPLPRMQRCAFNTFTFPQIHVAGNLQSRALQLIFWFAVATSCQSAMSFATETDGKINRWRWLLILIQSSLNTWMCKQPGMYNGDTGTSLTGELGFDPNDIMRSHHLASHFTLRKDLEHVAAPAHHKEDRHSALMAKACQGDFFVFFLRNIFIPQVAFPPGGSNRPVAAQCTQCIQNFC